MEDIGFIRKNKKGLAIVLPLWCVVVIVGLIGLQAAARNRADTLFTKGVAAVDRFADQCSSPLMEDDVLGLIRIASEFQREHKVLFAAVLNHQNKIVAHSNPDKLNQEFTFKPGNQAPQTIGQALVSMGHSADGNDMITFSRNITFSNVKIGSAVYGMSSSAHSQIISRYRLYRILLVVLGTLVAASAFFVMGRSRSRKQEPVKSMPESEDGTRIGPYHLKSKIAQGGMAELYMADYIRDDGFRRAVAIKKVLPHLAENQDFINMFIREARLAALLQHPNIVQIFDFGKIRNTYFIAMEYFLRTTFDHD